MSVDSSKAYELLGVKPGVSIRELKAAHRDLAKVWHPDRFLHDPRLQEKAQEKLKEINEAYEMLSSGKIPRAATNPPRPPKQYHTVQYAEAKPAAPSRGIKWPWAAVPLLVFAAVFAITTRTLLQRRSVPVPEQGAQVEESVNLEQDHSQRPDSNTRAEVKNASQRSNSENAEVTPSDSITTEPTPALPTVTVTIDPETGLLAKRECTLRSRMTYPSGSQPTGYCNLSHIPPPKESRIKSLAKKIQDVQ